MSWRNTYFSSSIDWIDSKLHGNVAYGQAHSWLVFDGDRPWLQKVWRGQIKLTSRSNLISVTVGDRAKRSLISNPKGRSTSCWDASWRNLASMTSRCQITPIIAHSSILQVISATVGDKPKMSLISNPKGLSTSYRDVSKRHLASMTSRCQITRLSPTRAFCKLSP